MSFDNEAIFTKENLDGYLKELAKAFRKRNEMGRQCLLRSFLCVALQFL